MSGTPAFPTYHLHLLGAREPCYLHLSRLKFIAEKRTLTSAAVCASLLWALISQSSLYLANILTFSESGIFSFEKESFCKLQEMVWNEHFPPLSFTSSLKSRLF